MKNVLIPTDFTLNSLDYVAIAAKSVPFKCSIFLFHAFDMPQSLMDAIHKSGLKSHHKLVTEELRLKCKKIKSENSNIVDICFKTMYGTTVNAFRNYAEANDIDLIFLPADFEFKAIVRDSVDPTHMFEKAGLSIIREDVSKEYTTTVKKTQTIEKTETQYI